MTTPVNPSPSSQTTSGYYDAEGGLCVDPSAAPPTSSSSAPPASSTRSDTTSSAAVDQLVQAASAKKSDSCLYPVLEAALSCAGAATAIVIGSGTGAGAVAAAAIGGAVCGVKVIRAEECLTR